MFWSSHQREAFVVECRTTDPHDIALPVVVHFRVVRAWKTAKHPDYKKLTTDLLANVIAAEASYLTSAEISQQRDQLCAAAIGFSRRQGPGLNIARYVRKNYGVRIIKVLINSPKLDAVVQKEIDKVAVNRNVARNRLQHSAREKDVKLDQIERIMNLPGLSVQEKIVILYLVLRNEVMHGGGDNKRVFFENQNIDFPRLELLAERVKEETVAKIGKRGSGGDKDGEGDEEDGK